MKEEVINVRLFISLNGSQIPTAEKLRLSVVAKPRTELAVLRLIYNACSIFEFEEQSYGLRGGDVVLIDGLGAYEVEEEGEAITFVNISNVLETDEVLSLLELPLEEQVSAEAREQADGSVALFNIKSTRYEIHNVH